MAIIMKNIFKYIYAESIILTVNCTVLNVYCYNEIKKITKQKKLHDDMKVFCNHFSIIAISRRCDTTKYVSPQNVQVPCKFKELHFYFNFCDMTNTFQSVKSDL